MLLQVFVDVAINHDGAEFAGDICHGTAGTHARELKRHAWEPNDGVRQTS